jgi:hypothetical protein
VSRCGTQFAISIDELKELANGQVMQICSSLLPNGRENCGYWEVGSIEGEPGKSLKINLRGATRGLWTDFSAPKGAPDYSGNIIQLVAQVEFRGNVGHACQWLRSFLGLDDMDPNRLAAEKAKATRAAAKAQTDAAEKAERNRRRAHQLFLSAVPYLGTPAETYLVGASARFPRRRARSAGRDSLSCGSVYCAETRSKLPAMVASIVHMDGRHLGTHRTWLQPNGNGKASLIEPKKSLGKYQGGFIPLWKGKHKCSMKDLPPGTPIYVSEGIEDGLSAVLAKPSIRCIAGVSLSNIGGARAAGALPGPYPRPARREDEGDRGFRERSVARLQERKGTRFF